MADVYRGSVLNIAATAATCLTSSYFSNRDRSYINPGRVHVISGGATSTFRFVDSAIYYNNLQGLQAAPLHRRGWVLQERILAPRTLHLAETQLFWECHCQTACETFPDNVPLSFRSQEYRLFTKSTMPQIKPLQDDWVKIIEQYTASDLTFSSDRLMAIAGVAQDFASRTGLTYCAGVWAEHVLKDVCWYAGNDQSHRSRPQSGTVFPSWSFAAYDVGFIRMIAHDARVAAEYAIIRTDATWTTANRYGNVATARLLCYSTLLTKVKLQSYPPRSYHHIPAYDRGYFLYMRNRCISCRAYLDPGRKAEDVCFMLPIIAIWTDELQKSFLALLLERYSGRSDHDPGSYVRVGLVEIQDFQDPNFSNILTQLHESVEKEPLAASDYISAQTNDKGRKCYEIQIV
jgi:hypothetical protein